MSTPLIFFFFFNDTATTEIYTLSLHDALPISVPRMWPRRDERSPSTSPMYSSGVVISISSRGSSSTGLHLGADRKSTRLNSSHSQISYAVFCLKKKKITDYDTPYFAISTVYR